MNADSLLKGKISVSTRDKGFELAGKSHLIYQGFLIQKQSGAHSPAAIHGNTPSVYGITPGLSASGVKILNNELRWIACPDNTAAINVTGLDHSLVSGNEIYDNKHCRGIILTEFNDSVCSKNRLRRNGGTAIDFYHSHRSQMIGNTLVDNTGDHGNGLTVYLDSSDILVAYNRVSNSNAAFTCQNSKDLTVAYNIFTGPLHTVAASWGGVDGLKVFNNVILIVGDEKSTNALNLGKKDKRVIIKNNILKGTSATPKDVENLEMSNNIYTGLCWTQKESELGPGEKVIKDLTTIFVDPAHGDYHLKSGSPAIGAGVNWGAQEDIAGVKIPEGKSPDLGAYQSVP